ncbi:serine hydrolase domain-containing protein [Pararhizobium mangrovi]|uniref:Beta-lactamase family protein n=1 Tax=Pararhizobium mangrovi TaxID=2590452 RepID=A0A506TZ16_9HYPH|nr:serine hydrolase domain-containing protein [Pararhizobium mangrovi]TPW26231.1 beta-lactamase family protein [Pararhizobium mangrovi]
MEDWLEAGLAYAHRWMDYQLAKHQQPGCQFAVATANGECFERSYGVADIASGEALTDDHRFRVASHSKTFTAVAIMKLREAGKLNLDTAVGTYVDDLDAAVAETTLGQLLSHTSGLMRDGRRAGHWQRTAAFFDAEALGAELAEPLVIDANTRFKYSNIAFGLLGLVIESVTGEPYADWVMREVVLPSGLERTVPDVGDPAGQPLASGHSARMPFGHKAIDGAQSTHALAAATGFVSTAGDLARFFASLDPEAERSVLTPASRREMVRRQWHVPHRSVPRSYGLGTMTSTWQDLTLIGHAGAFPGFISRSAFVPDWKIAVSVVSNAIDGPAEEWLEGIVSILAKFHEEGAPKPAVEGWAGRWWTVWSPIDLVPMGGKVAVSAVGAAQPFRDASELEITDGTSGRIALANGFANHGEPVRRTFDEEGNQQRLYLGGSEWVTDPNELAIFDTPAVA